MKTLHRESHIINTKYYNNKASNSEEYNEIIQNKLEAFVPSGNNYWTSQMSYFRISADILKKGRELGKDITICHADQVYAQEDENSLNDDGFLWREPTNEEISFQVFLGLIYGAKQTLHFEYNVMLFQVGLGNTFPFYGLADASGNPRYENVYKYSNNTRQQKWNYVVNLDARLKAIGDYMYPAGHPEKHLLYDDYRTVNTFPVINPQPPYVTIKRGLSSQNPAQYIMDIQSIYRDNAGDFPDGPNCINCDPEAKRYWEFGFFNPNPLNGNPNDKSKYFIALNKRCTPESPGGLYDGDVRLLKIKFNPSELPNFNNWKLIDPINNTLIATIDKNSTQFYTIATFQPGEGKLFKLAPVMQEGGTLFCDESISGTTFNCNGPVFSNGKNITVGNRTTITFSTNAGISMQNANFVCSITGDIGTNGIILRPNANSYWQGVSVEYGSVQMDGTKIYDNFSGQDGIYIIRGSECSATNISGCKFYLTGSSRAISFDAYSSNEEEEDAEYYHDYLMNNEINADGSDNPVAFYSGTGESGLKIMMDGNRFTCVNNPGGTAAFLNLYNGVLDGNIIDNFSTGVLLSYSNISFTGNSILNSSNGANAINAVANSFAAMGYDGNSITGGGNSLNIAGSDAKILEFYNSIFNLGSGNNNFNLTDYDALDIYGYSQLNNGQETPEIDATDNCFYYNNSEMYHNTDYTNGNGGNQYSFIYGAEQCMTEQRAMDFIVELDYNIKDTIYKLSNSSENLSTAKQLIKNVNVNFRKAEYENVKQNCELLLSSYLDSIAVNDVISKLYVSVLNLDTNGLLIQNLKGILEQLILQHPSKIDLISCAFYYIQKCKVVNADYNSALQGFQQIIQQNPYDYIGLVASWDYAATILLRDTIGAGGISNEQFVTNDEQNIKTEESYLKDLEIYLDRFEREKYDSTKFSKQDRKQIKETLSKTFSDTRKQQITKFEGTKKLSEKGNKKAREEVIKMKTLNETVVLKKPKNNIEFGKIIHKDIAKVFGKSITGNTKTNNNIPTEYNLSQNYPNPFNPVTKINYELPKDGRVKLVIYDILGRQIKILVNELKQAGRYTIEFNGNNYASGVYFYRIQVEGGKSYTAVKKMILIK